MSASEQARAFALDPARLARRVAANEMTGGARYTSDAAAPDPLYRESSEEIAAAYDAWQAENEKGRDLSKEWAAARDALNAYVKAADPAAYREAGEEARLRAEKARIEKALRTQAHAARRALLAYDRLCVEAELAGGTTALAYRRMIDARDRAATLAPDLIEALKSRERYWTLAGQRFSPGAEADGVQPGTVTARVVDAQNKLGDLERVLAALIGGFPKVADEYRPKTAPPAPDEAPGRRVAGF